MSERVRWRGSGGKGLTEKIHRRRSVGEDSSEIIFSDGEGPSEKVCRRRSAGEGLMEEIQ